MRLAFRSPPGYAARMNAGQKISRLLADRLWSQAALAQRASINPATLNAIVRGNIPRVNNAIAIAQALNVPVDWLFDDVQDWPPPEPGTERPYLSDGEMVYEAQRRVQALIRDLGAARRELREALKAWNPKGPVGKAPPAVQEAALRFCSTTGLLANWKTKVERELDYDYPLELGLVASKCLPNRFLRRPSDGPLDMNQYDYELTDVSVAERAANDAWRPTPEEIRKEIEAGPGGNP